MGPHGTRTFVSTKDACALLGVSFRLLRAAMDSTPADMSRPWFRYAGSEERPHWQWEADQIAGWWKAVNHYRFNREGEGDHE